MMTHSSTDKTAPPSWEEWRESSASLSTLLDAVQRRNEAEAAVTTQISALRQAECPWSVIAWATGTTKQGAQQRYAASRVSTVDRELPGS